MSDQVNETGATPATISNQFLHMYGHHEPHGAVELVGTAQALGALRAAIGGALSSSSGKVRAVFFCADGEGYTLGVKANNANWQSDDWQDLPLPYCVDLTMRPREDLLSLNEYQAMAGATSGAGTFAPETRQIVSALGAAGEAGEFANLVKKRLFHGHRIDQDKFVDELGDVLWYLAEAATAHGLTLDEVAKFNLAKLKRRYPHGFSEEASRNRTD